MLKNLILASKIFLGCVLFGIIVAAYLIYHFSSDLPDYSQLKEYHPPCVTRVYTYDGKLIEEYAKEKRIFVPIGSVPKSLVHAFIAAEDKNFYHHPGIDVFSIIRAAFANVSHALHGTRFEGGSTITQQVVKNFLLSSERSIERKVKEAILSYMLTKTFSKEQILELYLNQLFLGKGYGVAAAALGYFNKSVEELSIAESAFLASLPKAPSQYGSEKNYEKALARRNYVIGRMYDDNYITEEEARAAIAEPIKLVKQDEVERLNADYYAEQVRSEVIGLFGEEYFYTAGLTIITCAEANLQRNAANALRFGIKAWDMKKGYRGPLKNIPLTNWQADLLAMPAPIGLRHYKMAIVLEVGDLEAKIGFSNGKTASIKLSDMKWTKTILKSVKDLLKNGDVIVVENNNGAYQLQQIPEINGGIMVVEPFTGRVLASEGGYDYDISKFDRTTQALRQPGSLIKPFVFLTALENGTQPNEVFEDAPVEIYVGPGLPLWRPKNWDNKYMGPMTFRRGLERSRNGITVRVAKTVGFKKIAETLKRLSINDDPVARPSIILGALETTLERMTMAFSVFANEGQKVTPHYIELIKDRKGNVLYRRGDNECNDCKNTDGETLPTIPETKGATVVDEATNYQIVSILNGAARRGTAASTNVIGKTLAAKTGTSNEGKDTWFIGFTPKMLVGTYVGYDTPKTMGRSATGATVAAPIYVEFMKNAYKDIESVEFPVPASINLVSVDKETGVPSTGTDTIIEAFKVPGYSPKIDYNNDNNQEIREDSDDDGLDPFSKLYNEDNNEDKDASEEVY
jgi:penicillin-binding protein 1A